ncbi:MAG TPA: SurA N-terminal domain-containing protein, partial [Longimicrobiaceae bacterium]|nr:SurA N-terminal domain-containing protein [Longimicrobiaceae bacterium]
MMRNLVIPALLLAAAPLQAQVGVIGPHDEQLIDRVVAVVGDSVLLLSDIQSEIEQLRSTGQLPTDPVELDRLARSIFENNVNDLILLAAAEEAGTSLSEDRLNDMVNQEIRQVEQRFGSAAAFEAALAESGLTRERYRQTI